MKVYPSLDNFLDAAAEYCGVSPDDMRNRGRHPNVARARWLFYIAARSTKRFSLPEIARANGRDSHSTVVDAVKQATRRNPELFDEANEVVELAMKMVAQTPKVINKSLPIGADNTHLIRKINSLASRVTALEEQLQTTPIRESGR